MFVTDLWSIFQCHFCVLRAAAEVAVTKLCFSTPKQQAQKKGGCSQQVTIGRVALGQPNLSPVLLCDLLQHFSTFSNFPCFLTFINTSSQHQGQFFHMYPVGLTVILYITLFMAANHSHRFVTATLKAVFWESEDQEERTLWGTNND